MAFSLSLSGGGCRAAAHIGVIKALSEYSLAPAAVSGTSAGAIAAALYASGYSYGDLYDICLQLSKKGHKFIDWNISNLIVSVLGYPVIRKSNLSGILKGEQLYSFLNSLFGDSSIKDISVPLFIAATDLATGNTVSFSQISPERQLPETVWLDDISLCDAVYCSCCLPGIFSPIKTPYGVLVDGGVSDNLPVDLLFAAGYPNIIAVDLSDYRPDDSINGIFETAYRSVAVMSNKLKNCYVRGERLNIKPKLPHEASVFSFDLIEECIEAGYNAAYELIPLIKSL